jgi:membrane protein
MKDVSPQSPEARRKRLATLEAAFGHEVVAKLRPGARPFEILKRIAVGVYNDGFIHAGNLAFLSLMALFPFFIIAAALAQILGESDSARLTVATVLSQVPPGVADTLRDPIQEVLTVRTGPLLWFGAIISLWTVGSFIETIRDILRRCYGVKFCAPFWEYRLGSILMIIGAVVLMLFAFALSVVLSSVQHAIEAWIPFADNVVGAISVYRVIPAVALFGTIYGLFFALTPARYRKGGCPKWPGALLITIWWLGTVEILPNAIGLLGGYDLTYGSLAGVMIVLLFFFFIGLGVVAGAELNAALAEVKPTALKGEIYSGPFKDELEVEEPQPGEDVELIPAEGGPQL